MGRPTVGCCSGVNVESYPKSAPLLIKNKKSAPHRQKKCICSFFRKNDSHLEGLSHIIIMEENVPNHQPDMFFFSEMSAMSANIMSAFQLQLVEHLGRQDQSRAWYIKALEDGCSTKNREENKSLCFSTNLPNYVFFSWKIHGLHFPVSSVLSIVGWTQPLATGFDMF